MIQDKYLLVIMIPYYIDEDNRRSTDALWDKDIIKHLVQISDLTLAAPARYGAPPDKVVPIDPAMFSKGHSPTWTRPPATPRSPPYSRSRRPLSSCGEPSESRTLSM
jgi:hypothetical protein